MQVKLQLGKDQYKHRLLPLLRQYRQDKDTCHLTSGAPARTVPKLAFMAVVRRRITISVAT